MKKILAVLMTLAVVTGLLAGCGTQTKPDSGATPAPSQPKDVTISFWTISLKPTFDDYINGVIKSFEAKNPTIHVKWTDLPIQSIQDKLMSAIAADEAPDVVNLNTDFAMAIAVKGGLAAMDDLTTPEERSVYFDKLFKSAEYNGKTYALPWYAAGQVMMFNTDIVKKAGLDPTKPPTTKEELAAWAKTIKEKTGKYTFRPEGMMATLFQDGVPILTPDKKKAAFNTPEGVAAVKWYADLYKDGTLPKDLLAKNYTDDLNMVMGGQMAMYLGGPQFIKRFKEQAPDVYKVLDVAPLPKGKARVDQVPLMNLVIPKLSKHQKEGAKFGLYMTNDDSQLAFSKIVSILPSTKKAAQDDFFKAKGNTPEDKAKEIVVQQLVNGFDLALGIGAKQSEIDTAITDAFAAAASGKKTPEEALKDAEKKANEILARD